MRGWLAYLLAAGAALALLLLVASQALAQDAAEVQARLDAGGIWRASGTYRLERAVVIRRPIQILGPVTFKAARTVEGARLGMIYAGYLAGVTLREVTIDGNREERAGAWYCDGTVNAYHGSNIHFDNVDDLVIDRVTTTMAVCGSGMHVIGRRARITGSRFVNNGLALPRHWADGLTLLQCDHCLVAGNDFIDNTDVGLVFGGGRQSLISRNLFRQSLPIFAALALDNFNGSRSGDFTGSIVTANQIECGVLCDFGINIGPHAWYLSAPITGGRVSGNAIFGGKIGILVGGAGTAEAPVAVYGNDIVPLWPEGSAATFSCGDRPAHAFLVSPDSVVNTAGEKTASGFHRLCP